MRQYLARINLGIAIPSLVFLAVAMLGMSWLERKWETNEIDDSQYLEIIANIDTHYNDDIKRHILKSLLDGKVVELEYKEFLLMASANETELLRAKDAKKRLITLFSSRGTTTTKR